MNLMLIKKDVRKQKGANITFFILLLFVFTLVITSVNSLLGYSNAYDSAAADNNAPDIIISFNEDVLSKEEATKYFVSNDNVENIYYKDYRSFSFDKSKNVDDIEHYALFAMGVDDEGSKYNVISNSYNGNLKADEAILPLIFDEFFDEGDTVYFEDNENKYSLKVVGFFQDSIFGSTLLTNKIVIVNNDFGNTLKKNHTMSLMYIYLDDYTVENVQKIDDEFKHPGINTLFEMSDFKSVTLIIPYMFTALLFIVALFILIVIPLVLNHTIKSFIYNNYKEYGVMISLGFDRRTLITNAVIKNVILTMIAFLISIVISYTLLPIVNNFVLSNVGLIWSTYFNLNVAIIILMLITFFVVLDTYIAMRKVYKLSVIRAISGKGEDIKSKNMLKINIGNFKSLNIAYSVKKVFVNIKSYLSLFILTTILVSVVFTTTAITVFTSNNKIFNQMLGISTSEIYITSTTTDLEEFNTSVNLIVDDINKNYGLESSCRFSAVSVKVEGDAVLANVYSTFDYYGQAAIIEGRMPRNSNEVALTPKFLKEYDVKISDTITITIEDVDKEYVIVGSSQTVSDIGRTVFLLDEDVSDLNVAATQQMIDIDDDLDSDEVIKALNEKFKGEYTIDEIKLIGVGDTTSISKGFLGFAIFTYVVTLFFISLVTYLLSSLAIMKEKKDIGIMKSLGFTSKQIEKQFVIRFFIISVTSGIIGTIIGYLFGLNIVTSILSLVGISKIIGDYTWYMFVIPVVLVTMINIIFVKVSCRKLMKIDPKELVATQE